MSEVDDGVIFADCIEKYPEWASIPVEACANCKVQSRTVFSRCKVNEGLITLKKKHMLSSQQVIP